VSHLCVQLEQIKYKQYNNLLIYNMFSDLSKTNDTTRNTDTFVGVIIDEHTFIIDKYTYIPQLTDEYNVDEYKSIFIGYT
jgi:hypothetical protein